MIMMRSQVCFLIVARSDVLSEKNISLLLSLFTHPSSKLLLHNSNSLVLILHRRNNIKLLLQCHSTNTTSRTFLPQRRRFNTIKATKHPKHQHRPKYHRMATLVDEFRLDLPSEAELIDPCSSVSLSLLRVPFWFCLRRWCMSLLVVPIFVSGSCLRWWFGCGSFKLGANRSWYIHFVIDSN